MSTKRFLLVLCTALLLLPFSSYGNGPGFEITSTLGHGRIVTIVSREGVVVTQYENANDMTKPARGAIVRYGDHAVWGIDHERRSVISASLSRRMEIRKNELARAMNAVPAGVPAGPGLRIHLHATGETATINQYRLRAYLLKDGTSKWRLWYASDLPAPPDEVRRQLGSFMTLDVHSAAAMQEIAGRQPLRVELYGPEGWKKVLDTTSIRHVEVKSSEFAPPSDYETDVRRVTGAPQAGPLQDSASVLPGPGPVMNNVEVYAVYWGPALAAASTGFFAGMGDAIGRAGDQRYLHYLNQYGINSIKAIHNYSRPAAPSRDVGTANFVAASAIVYDIGFNEDAPIFWWEVGGHDPLYALFVTDDEVDRDGWAGYHFVAFSLTHLVLPFPISLFAHDGIPYSIVKVPHGGLALPAEALAFRANCRLNRNPRPPQATCDAINEFDEGTKRTTHELVEAASDPYPFTGWLDPTRQPAWKYSEIADICATSRHLLDATVVGQSYVATFWSDHEAACVPDGRPTLRILQPTAGQAIPFVANPVVLSGVANDPGDGLISDRIEWDLPGFHSTGATVSATLPLGSYTAHAMVRNSWNVSATKDVPFSVVDQPPQAVIYSPADGASFGTDENILFRGGSPLGQQPLLNPAWTLDGAPFFNAAMLTSRINKLGSRIITFSGNSASGLTGSKTITINITPATGAPGIQITSPANNAAFPARDAEGNLSNHSLPITFSAQQISGSTSGAIYRWDSDIDGFLGNGLGIKVPLSGLSCGIITHRITATVTVGVRSASDTITLMIGQIC